MNLDSLKDAVGIMDKLIVDCIVFFIILTLIYSMHVTDMQKREWCYAYLQADVCFCQSNRDNLLNKSLTIDPYRPNSWLDVMDENQRKNFTEEYIINK